GGADDEAVLRERVEGVAEDDRHDRHARAHRHVEGALLERAETKGGAARALRRDDERGALPERGDRRPERVDRALAVGAVDEHRAELAPGGDRQVHHVAPAAIQEARDRADPEGRNDARDRERRADDLAEARPAAAREALDRPASPAGDRRQPAARVRRPRLADDLEQRQVLVAVGVEVALPELDAELARERARRQRLPAAVARGPDVAAREPPVL